MRTVEITRTGHASVADHVAEMQAWFREAGIDPLELEAISILNARIRFRASFADAGDAERFRAKFDEESAPTPRA